MKQVTKLQLLGEVLLTLVACVLEMVSIFLILMFLNIYNDDLRTFGLWIGFGLIPSVVLAYYLWHNLRFRITIILDLGLCKDYHDPDLPYDPDPDYELDVKDKIVLGTKAMTD